MVRTAKLAGVTALCAFAAAWIVYGALEEILTGWVMGQLPDADEDVADAERAVAATFARGLA